jgi:hypothetical protein
MKYPLVYIIILNWNGYKDTIECLKSLLKIDYKNYKIILIDNASTNDSVKEIKSKFPNIKLLENLKNLGFSGGCNVGIRYALKHDADYILLLNNDTVVSKNFLSELVSVGETDEKIGILSPFIYLADKPEVIWSSGLNFNFRNSWPFIDKNKSKIDRGQFKNNRKVEFLTGCSMLIKKSVIDKIGLYKEEYFLYIEDMDYSLMAVKNDFSLYAIPSSKVWHKIGKSSDLIGKENVRYYFIRNLIFFYKNNYSFVDNLIFNSIFLKESFYQIYKHIIKKEFKMAKVILQGILDGYIGRTGSYSHKL